MISVGSKKQGDRCTQRNETMMASEWTAQPHRASYDVKNHQEATLPYRDPLKTQRVMILSHQRPPLSGGQRGGPSEGAQPADTWN